MTANTRRQEIKEEMARLEAELEMLPEQWEPRCGLWYATSAGYVRKGSADGHVVHGATCNSQEAAQRRISLITAIMRLDRWVEENGQRGEWSVILTDSGYWVSRKSTGPLEVLMSGKTADAAAEALNNGTLSLHVESNKSKIRPIEVGDYVAFYDDHINVRKVNECQMLTVINRHDDRSYGYNYQTKNGMCWKYVRRWSDGAVFGPGGKFIEII